jgi:hypothetical protein
MKLHGACLIALLLAATAADAQTIRRIRPSRPLTVRDLVRQLPPPRDEQGTRRKVISADGAEDTLIIAAAGNVQGSGGTFFRSDLAIVNHRNADQEIGVGFLAQGVDNSTALLDYFVLEANTPVLVRDFVGVELQKTGLGSLFIQGVLSNGDRDDNAQLTATSRIWTPQPGSAGTVSQGFPSVYFFDSFGTGAAFALGGRHDTQFRTNAGVVNLDGVSHTWTIDVNGVGGRTAMTITVPPFSMRQQVVPNGNWGDLVLAFEPDAGGFYWSSYLAAVDNITGDSWSAHGAQP